MSINTQRRSLMKALPAAGLSLGLPVAANAATAPDPWLQAQAIVDHVSKPLKFRKQDFDITAYGAKTCKLSKVKAWISFCLLYTSPSPRDRQKSRMPSSA